LIPGDISLMKSLANDLENLARIMDKSPYLYLGYETVGKDGELYIPIAVQTVSRVHNGEVIIAGSLASLESGTK
jgi:hypothetical protein